MINDQIPAKIAVAGDWHGNRRWGRHAIQRAGQEKVDVILHTGDFGYDFRPDFVKALDEMLGSFGIELYFVDGNHENHEWLARLSQNEDGTGRVSKHISHLPRGFRWEWDGLRFLAIGGAVSMDQNMRTRGVSWWPEETVTLRDVEAAVEGGPVDVVIAHDAPFGHDIPTVAEQAHWFPEELLRASDSNRQMLRLVADAVQPLHWFHGHYHVAYFKELLIEGNMWLKVYGLDRDEARTDEDNLVFRTLDQLRTIREGLQ